MAATNKTNTSKTNTSNNTNKGKGNKGKGNKGKTSNAATVAVPVAGTATSNNATVAVGTTIAKKPSNKQQVFAAWQKMVVSNNGIAPKPTTIAPTLHQQFNLNGLVALPTLAGWLSAWANGKNLPSGQVKNTVPSFIKGTYRSVVATPATTTK